MVTSRRRMAAAAIGGGCLVIALAACGSATLRPSASTTRMHRSASTPATPTASASASPAATTAAGTTCPAPALTATVPTTRGGAAAGTDYVPIDLTNHSSHSCTLYGYPGVSFVTGTTSQPGSQIGQPALRDTAFGPVTVTLSAGQTAHAWLGIADVGNFSQSECRPVTAHVLRVYPPGDYHPVYASFSTQVCSGTITGGSHGLTVMTVHPGAGVAGQVP